MNYAYNVKERPCFGAVRLAVVSVFALAAFVIHPGAIKAETTTTVPFDLESECGRPGTEQFNACYYDNRDFTNVLVNRTDPQINFDWGSGFPDPAIQPETFSAKWRGLFTFEAGEYEFTIVTDDGIRVNVDNETIVDKMFDQPATTYTVRKTMPAGQRGVIVEYYENTGDAVAKVSWKKVSAPPSEAGCVEFADNAFNACYYDNRDFTNFKVQRTDQKVDFDWGGGSPDPSVAIDTFSARWRGEFPFEAGEYEFTVVTDDGFKLALDNEVILNKMFDQPPTTYTVRKTMTAGEKKLLAEYYENGGGAIARLSWKKVSSPPIADCVTPGNGTFNACYYNNPDFKDLKVNRNDSAIDFNWGTGTPDQSVDPETFSATWIGNFSLEPGEYEFTVVTDDGFRLRVNDTVILDKMYDQPATTYTVRANVTSSDSTTIKAEYYENTWDAVARVSWKKAEAPVGDGMVNLIKGFITSTPNYLSQRAVLHGIFATDNPPSDNVLLNLELSNSQNQKVAQAWYDNVRILDKNEIDRTLDVPQYLPGGMYSFDVGIFQPGWDGLIKWYDDVATFRLTDTGQWEDNHVEMAYAWVNPPKIRTGQTSILGASFMSPHTENHVYVDLALLDSTNAKVAETVHENVALPRSGTGNYDIIYTLQSPPTLASGTYTFRVSIHTLGKEKLIAEYLNAATLVVE